MMPVRLWRAECQLPKKWRYKAGERSGLEVGSARIAELGSLYEHGPVSLKRLSHPVLQGHSVCIQVSPTASHFNAERR